MKNDYFFSVKSATENDVSLKIYSRSRDQLTETHMLYKLYDVQY